MDNEEDESCATSFFKCGQAFQGYLYSLFCIPFMCCGIGPIVQVEEGYRATVLKYGKLTHIVGPGTYHRNIGTETFIINSIQIQTLEIPSQQVMTKDSVAITLDAVCFYKIDDLKRAVFNVSNSEDATRNLCQSVLEQLLGEKTLDELLSSRQAIAERLAELISAKTEDWGIHVQALEIRDIRVPQSIQRVMAAVAEAQREGQAKVVMADAELRAADSFKSAARIMSKNPIALQLRYFQTLTEIAADKHSTIVVPSEVTNMFRPLTSWSEEAAEERHKKEHEQKRRKIKGVDESS